MVRVHSNPPFLRYMHKAFSLRTLVRRAKTFAHLSQKLKSETYLKPDY